MANIDDLDAAGPELPAARSRGFLTVLWQRKALLILATLLGLVGGSLFYWQRPPIYQSASQILIIKKQPVLPVAERMGYADDYMSTHLEVLRSPLIIERAIKKKELAALKTFEDSSDPVGQIIASLTVDAPASMRRAIASPRSVSRENTDEARPYGLSLARRTASSSSRTFMIGSVGPNVSSVMIFMEWSTSTSSVGS